MRTNNIVFSYLLFFTYWDVLREHLSQGYIATLLHMQSEMEQCEFSFLIILCDWWLMVATGHACHRIRTRCRCSASDKMGVRDVRGGSISVFPFFLCTYLRLYVDVCQILHHIIHILIAYTHIVTTLTQYSHNIP